MKKIINLVSILILISTLFTYCKNDEISDEEVENLIYESLISENDTLNSGETTYIKAIANGTQINYYWSASAGEILGSGNEVIYATSPCVSGKNKITCKVKDILGNSEEKYVYVVVK